MFAQVIKEIIEDMGFYDEEEYYDLSRRIILDCASLVPEESKRVILEHFKVSHK